MTVLSAYSCCLICLNGDKMNLCYQQVFSPVLSNMNYTKVAGFIFSLASQRHKSSLENGSYKAGPPTKAECSSNTCPFLAR